MADGEVKKESLKPVLIVIAILLFVIAACMCVFCYQAVDGMIDEKKAEAKKVITPSQTEKEISLAKKTLYENGIIATMLDNVSSINLPDWRFFESNTGHYVVEVKGVVDDPVKFTKSITSNRTDLRFSDIYYYKDDDIVKAAYKIQFVKSLGTPITSEYNIYKLLYTEYTLDVKNENGEVEQVKVNGGLSDILDHFEAYLQDKNLNNF